MKLAYEVQFTSTNLMLIVSSKKHNRNAFSVVLLRSNTDSSC